MIYPAAMSRVNYPSLFDPPLPILADNGNFFTFAHYGRQYTEA